MVGISSRVGCSTQCPSTICAPVLNSSQPVQYNPSYSASNRSAGWRSRIRSSRAPTARACRGSVVRIQSSCEHCRRRQRSEEHTSELQSRLHLVCRLLLEKKKKKYKTH